MYSIYIYIFLKFGLQNLESKSCKTFATGCCIIEEITLAKFVAENRLREGIERSIRRARRLNNTNFQKKDDKHLSQFHISACMLSCEWKAIEMAIGEQIARSVNIYGRKFSFQSILSLTITLIDGNETVKQRNNKISSLGDSLRHMTW